MYYTILTKEDNKEDMLTLRKVCEWLTFAG